MCPRLNRSPFPSHRVTRVVIPDSVSPFPSPPSSLASTLPSHKRQLSPFFNKHALSHGVEAPAGFSITNVYSAPLLTFPLLRTNICAAAVHRATSFNLHRVLRNDAIISPLVPSITMTTKPPKKLFTCFHYIQPILNYAPPWFLRQNL